MIRLEHGSVLVLDLDDTLYPERTYVRSGLLAVARWVDGRWGHSDFFDIAWRAFLAGARGKLFNNALAQLGTKPSHAEILTMVDVYRNHEPDIALYPDARRLLDRTPCVANLALITDGAAVSQRRKIAALGLDDVLQHIVVTDELGRDSWKPSVVPFNLVTMATGARADQLVYVGDNVRKDFIAPNALGWQTIRITRDDSVHAEYEPQSTVHMPHRTVTSLDDLQWSRCDTSVGSRP